MGCFLLDPLTANTSAGSSRMNKVLKVGLIVGCVLLVLGLSGVGFYAFQQKKRAKKAIELSNPFGMFCFFNNHLFASNLLIY